MKDAVLKTKLDRLVALLGDYHEADWHAYFRSAQDIFAQGEYRKAKKKIRGAYGGMCSFNDALHFTGAPKEIAEEGFRLRDEIYTLSEPEGILDSIVNLIK